MNEDNIDYVREKSSVLTDATAEIAASLTTVEGSHADFMLINKKKTIQQVYRFRRTAYDKWMSPTNAKDQKTADEALAKFSEPSEALKYLASLE